MTWTCTSLANPWFNGSWTSPGTLTTEHQRTTSIIVFIAFFIDFPIIKFLQTIIIQFLILPVSAFSDLLRPIALHVVGQFVGRLRCCTGCTSVCCFSCCTGCCMWTVCRLPWCWLTQLWCSYWRYPCLLFFTFLVLCIRTRSEKSTTHGYGKLLNAQCIDSPKTNF